MSINENDNVQRQKKTLVITICLALVFVVAMAVPSRFMAHAVFSGQSSGITRADLHAVTLETSVKYNDPATITVLTHGLGGDARDWSNNFTGTKGSGTVFSYDPVSIVERIRNAAPSGINLYRAVVNESIEMYLYSEYTNIQMESINFSQHTVIVVSTPTYIAMQDMYELLHYVIDKISYEFYRAMGVLPRLNLIGHSMGGLLNMQYTIAHPKNVASLISIGTPYNGSWYDNPFVELLGIDSFEQQKCITGACNHDYYFCNLSNRKATWNYTYQNNTHINFHAISGTTAIGFMEHIIWQGNYLEDYFGSVQAIAIRSIFSLGFVISPVLMIAGTALLPGDLCVDESSQRALGYSGVNTYNKEFSVTNSNVNKRSQDNIPLPHNLECYDANIQNYILSVITIGSPFSLNQAGTITDVNISLSGPVRIPRVINQIVITAIGNNAFANTAITTLSIPYRTAGNIAVSAFEGCSKLQAVELVDDYGNPCGSSSCSCNMVNLLTATNRHFLYCTKCYKVFIELHNHNGSNSTCTCGGHSTHILSGWTNKSAILHEGTCEQCGYIVSELHDFEAVYNAGRMIWQCKKCNYKDNGPVIILKEPIVLDTESALDPFWDEHLTD